MGKREIMGKLENILWGIKKNTTCDTVKAVLKGIPTFSKKNIKSINQP